LERQSSEVNTMPVEEMERLDGVDRLLTDCKDLLLRSEPQRVDPPSSVMSSEQDLAA